MYRTYRPAHHHGPPFGRVLAAILAFAALFGLAAAVLGGGVAAAAGGLLLLPLLVAKFLFFALVVGLVVRLALRVGRFQDVPRGRWQDRDRRRYADEAWVDQGERWGPGPWGPSPRSRDLGVAMSQEEAEWEAFLDEARGEVDEIDRNG